MDSPRGRLVEIFSGIQGEGLLVGQRQIFIRFFGCNLRCRYCDTPESLTNGHHCRIESTPGLKDFKTFKNPLGIAEVISAIKNLNKTKNLHHSISLTGGEPLFQIEFLEELYQRLKDLGLKLFLETNGILHQELSRVTKYIDLIGMDFKLSSFTGMKSFWKEHEKFLKISCKNKAFVKIVVTQETTSVEILHACNLIAKNSVDTPLILQPVTLYGNIKKQPSMEQLLYFQKLCKQSLNDVRIIPQVHKLMGEK